MRRTGTRHVLSHFKSHTMPRYRFMITRAKSPGSSLVPILLCWALTSNLHNLGIFNSFDFLFIDIFWLYSVWILSFLKKFPSLLYYHWEKPPNYFGYQFRYQCQFYYYFCFQLAYNIVFTGAIRNTIFWWNLSPAQPLIYLVRIYFWNLNT